MAYCEFNSDDPTIKLMRKLSTREGFIDEDHHQPTTMVDAYWDVEYIYMIHFNGTDKAPSDSFKSVLSKARKKRFSP